MIARSAKRLKSCFDQLGPGDVFIGPVIGKHLESFVMIDLAARGVTVLPSCLSQTLARSKTAQAFILNRFVPPLTFVIPRRIELLETINLYNREKVGRVVTKLDHKHCGHGVRLWDSIETLYSVVGLEESSYPFVLQPFMENFVDVRVVVAGDYIEAYKRENKNNFRANMAAGGKSQAYDMDEHQLDFCRRLMKRGDFPYAHIDLMVMESGDVYLSEIALTGGLKGARIDQRDLDRKKKKIIEAMARKIEMNSTRIGKEMPL